MSPDMLLTLLAVFLMLVFPILLRYHWRRRISVQVVICSTPQQSPLERQLLIQDMTRNHRNNNLN